MHHSQTYNGLYGEAPPERGTFFTLQVYERVGISRVEVYERVGKSVIEGLSLFSSGRYTKGVPFLPKNGV